MMEYVVKKGSITVNGISLTIIEFDDNFFSVGVIPYTWNNTVMKNLEVGDSVNIETDIFARYVEKLIARE